jgi:uncharacterized damage-inducible protein DinB
MARHVTENESRGDRMTLDVIERMYAHMHWADEQLLALMNSVPLARAQPSMRLFSHLLAAERVWMLRLRGENSSVQAIWPELTLEELNAMAAANRGDYAHYLPSLGEGDLTSEVAYASQRGDSYRTEVGDILIHVAMHGSYHRGQIASAIRAAGADPVNTDYITYVREQRAR